MKNKFLALAAVVMLFASCSDNDDNSINQSLLTKKWYFKETVVKGVTIPYEGHENCGKDYIEFLQDGVFKSVDIENCVSEVDPGTWAVNGNSLTLTFPGDTTDVENSTITNITTTTLQIQLRYDYDEDGEIDTIINNFTAE